MFSFYQNPLFFTIVTLIVLQTFSSVNFFFSSTFSSMFHIISLFILLSISKSLPSFPERDVLKQERVVESVDVGSLMLVGRSKHNFAPYDRQVSLKWKSAKQPEAKDKSDLFSIDIQLIITDLVHGIGEKIYVLERDAMVTKQEFYEVLEDYRTIHEFINIGHVVYPWDGLHPFEGYHVVYRSNSILLDIDELDWEVFRLVLTVIEATMLGW